MVIVVVLPALQAPLLGPQIGGRRPGALRFQIAMHALMRTVVLRMSRPGKLNGNALMNPPHTQLGQPAPAHRGKGRAIIDPDDPRFAMLAQQVFKDPQRTFELLVRSGMAADQIMTVAIAHR